MYIYTWVLEVNESGRVGFSIRLKSRVFYVCLCEPRITPLDLTPSVHPHAHAQAAETAGGPVPAPYHVRQLQPGVGRVMCWSFCTDRWRMYEC
jgi:hypothetical protein